MNVEQMMPTDARAAYIAAWNNLFSILCGWPESKVQDWIAMNGYESRLSDAKSMIFHRPPQYWVINYVVQDEAMSHLSGPTKADLIQDLTSALMNEKNFVEADSLDSKAIRLRVNRVLKPYGVALPSKVMPHYDSGDVFRVDDHSFATARNRQRSEPDKTRVLESVD